MIRMFCQVIFALWMCLLTGCAERVVPLTVAEQQAQAEMLETSCGDGVCELGESAFSCVQDCDVPPNLFCYAKACPEAYGACLELDDCADSLACWLGCGEAEDSFQCMEDCTASAEGAARFVFDAFAICADASGCVAGEEDETELEFCGDGVCEVWETGSICPADCGEVGIIEEPPSEQYGEGGEEAEEREDVGDEDAEDDDEPGEDGGGLVSDILGCLGNACPSEIESCEQEPACAGGLECALSCDDGDTGCLQACLTGGGLSSATISLGLCAVNSGCFDGIGEEPEGPVCGDGVCEEGEEGCEEDCGEEEEPGLIPGLPDAGGLIGCLTSECGEEIFECFGDPGCQEALFCLIGCGGDFGCLAGCFTGGGFSPGLIGLATCAIGSSCLGELGDLGGFGMDLPDKTDQEMEEDCGDGICDGIEVLMCSGDCIQ